MKKIIPMIMMMAMCVAAHATEPTVTDVMVRRVSKDNGYAYVKWSCKITAGSKGGRHSVKMYFLDGDGKQITWDIKIGIKIKAGKSATVIKTTMMSLKSWRRCNSRNVEVTRY